MGFLSKLFNKEDEFDLEKYSLDQLKHDDDDIPEGCAACGGPYPSCTTSCPLFDD